MQRNMFIFWKWKDFEDQIIDDPFWDIEANHKLLEDVSLGENKIWDNFKVFLKSSKGEELSHNESSVIRSWVKNGCGICMEFVKALIDYYNAEKSKNFVFLHRSDGFTHEEVKYILKETAANKCFLIGEGRDYIYFPTFKEGLLGDRGKFYSEPPGPDRPRITVANLIQKRVYEPYFSKVWHHYEHEFNIKIFELLYDLMIFLLPLNKTQSIDLSSWREHLNSNKLLMLRTKSFIRDEMIMLSKEEKTFLGKCEAKDQKSYEFDDCEMNLKAILKKPELSEYYAVSKLLFECFFDKKQSKTYPYTCKEYISMIQHYLNRLIKLVTPQNT